MKLLVVDPSRVVQSFCAEVCAGLGYQVETCSNGHQAMDKLDEGNFDVVIINPLIKKNSGLELVYEANSYNDLKDIKWILIADNTSILKENAEQLESIGVAAIISRVNLNKDLLANTVKALVHA